MALEILKGGVGAMSQNKEDMHMGEALAHAYFLDQIGGRGHTRVSAYISTSYPHFYKLLFRQK